MHHIQLGILQKLQGQEGEVGKVDPPKLALAAVASPTAGRRTMTRCVRVQSEFRLLACSRGTALRKKKEPLVTAASHGPLRPQVDTRTTVRLLRAKEWAHAAGIQARDGAERGRSPPWVVSGGKEPHAISPPYLTNGATTSGLRAALAGRLREGVPINAQ